MEQFTASDPPPDKGADGLVWTAHMNKLHHTAYSREKYHQ